MTRGSQQTEDTKKYPWKTLAEVYLPPHVRSHAEVLCPHEECGNYPWDVQPRGERPAYLWRCPMGHVWEVRQLTNTEARAFELLVE